MNWYVIRDDVSLQACRAKNVLCIVAPYEADAQLAYLEMQGITDFTITEDSDLLIYGCKKVSYCPISNT